MSLRKSDDFIADAELQARPKPWKNDSGGNGGDPAAPHDALQVVGLPSAAGAAAGVSFRLAKRGAGL